MITELDEVVRWAARRRAMVDEQIVAREVRDPAVIAAMRAVPRHLLVPAPLRDEAYDDGPLPIAAGQTISQPYIVAVMSERAEVRPGMRVLEIGTGSGYQCAVLGTMAAAVWSIEVLEPLATGAAAALHALGYQPHLRLGDGWAGWPEAAPFDAIVVTAAPPFVPPALVEQLAPGGRLVIPVGTRAQELQVIRKDPRGVTAESVFPVRFVPMVHGAN